MAAPPLRNSPVVYPEDTKFTVGSAEHGLFPTIDDDFVGITEPRTIPVNDFVGITEPRTHPVYDFVGITEPRTHPVNQSMANRSLDKTRQTRSDLKYPTREVLRGVESRQGESFKSRRQRPSNPPRPFVCSFVHYGCHSTFGSKNEWKRHVASQHLQLGYYRCDVGQCNSDNSKKTSTRSYNDFNRKDLFTQHLRRMHAPWSQSKTPSQQAKDDFEADLEIVRERCWRENRQAPQQSVCGFCRHLFDGPSSWEERMEHVGKHYEKGEGEEKEDEELRQWASREGVVYHVGKGLWRLKDLKEDHTHDKNKVALDDEEDGCGDDSDTDNYHPFRRGRPLLDPPQPKHATDWKSASHNPKQVRVRKAKSPLISENMPSKRDPVSSQSIEDAASRRTHRTMDSHNLRRPLIPTMAEQDGIEHEHQEEHSFDADLGSDKRTRAYSNPPVRPANQIATPGRAQLGRTRDISGRMSLADHAQEQLLNTLMTEFHRWISFIWSHGFYNCANQQGNESSERTVSSRPAPSFAAPRRNAQRTKRRKLPQDNDGEENGDEGRDDGDSSPAEAMPSQPVRKRKWACPFHKRNPSIFSSNATTRSKYRSCAGPGFDTIARLKEHLYRRHKPEKRCPRCWTEVKDNVALREHLNQDSRCAEREAPDIECLNDHMIQKLQSKKRSRGDAKDSEAEKWREIYVLIFHNTRGQIPSPFYDESMALDQPEKQPRSAEIGPDPEFQDYFQTNLSIMVEEGLKAIISEMFEPVDHKVSTSMPELVRTSIATVLKNWQSFQHRGASRLVDSHNGGSNSSGETRADVDGLSQPENEQNLDWDFIFEQFPLFSEDVPGLPNFGEDIF